MFFKAWETIFSFHNISGLDLSETATTSTRAPHHHPSTSLSRCKHFSLLTPTVPRRSVDCFRKQCFHVSRWSENKISKVIFARAFRPARRLTTKKTFSPALTLKLQVVHDMTRNRVSLCRQGVCGKFTQSEWARSPLSLESAFVASRVASLSVLFCGIVYNLKNLQSMHACAPDKTIRKRILY